MSGSNENRLEPKIKPPNQVKLDKIPDTHGRFKKPVTTHKPHTIRVYFLRAKKYFSFLRKWAKKGQNGDSYLDLTFRWTEMSIAELMQGKWPIF